MRLQISPVGVAAVVTSPSVEKVKTRQRPGRKPSPETQALIAAMGADHAAGKPKRTSDYITLLKHADPKKSDGAASQIVRREAKRIFGSVISRAPKAKASSSGQRGRKASPATGILREKLATDKASGAVRDASYYLRWLMDQKGIGVGLKGGRPIVYRELRAARVAG